MKIIPKFQNPSGPFPLPQKNYIYGVVKTPWGEARKQEDEEYNEYVSQPYFKIHQKPTKQQFRQQQRQRQQNRGEIRQHREVSAPVRAINNYIGEARYRAGNGTLLLKGKYTLPAIALASVAAPTMAAAPVTTIATMAGGYAGGKAVDFGTKIATGKTWAENVTDMTGLDPVAAEATNPGTLVGGGVGLKGLNLAKQRVLDAAYNNFTPLGYRNTAGLPFFNHKQEIIDMAKDFITPKRINTSVNTYPKWYDRAMNYIKQHPDAKGLGQINLDQVIKFRDEAWRLATNQKPRLELYTPNADGTYSFNMNVVNQVRNNQPLVLSAMKTGTNTGLTVDNITSNGGFLNVKLNNNRVFPTVSQSTFVGKPSLTMTDVWDLQPFKDTSRTFSPLITKLGNKYPKIFGKLKNVEVLGKFNGNPFTLNHTFPEGQVNLYVNPGFKTPK